MVTVEPGGRVLQPYPLHQIALLGMGPSAAAFANSVYYENFVPQKGRNEVWTLNLGHKVYKHHMLFDLHDLTDCERTGLIADYKKHDTYIVTIRDIAEIPYARELPFELIFSTFGDQYFSSGMAYIIAYAILCLEKQEKGEKILEISGFDFNYPDKHAYEAGRACVEYWIGRAVERGIDVRVQPASCLLDQYQRNFGLGGQGNGVLYGFGKTRPKFITINGKLELVGWHEPD